MTLLSRSKGGDQSNLALLALSLAPLLTLEGSPELAKTNEILDPGVIFYETSPATPVFGR